MFVYYFVTAPGPFEEAGRTVIETLEGDASHADLAYRHGEELRTHLHPDGGRPAKTVRMVLGHAVTGDREMTIPLVWEATGASALFPRMEADLVVSELAPGLSQVAFRGTYRPPLGPLGRALDRVLLHRLAEATVKNFLDRIAGAIVDPGSGLMRTGTAERTAVAVRPARESGKEGR